MSAVLALQRDGRVTEERHRLGETLDAADRSIEAIELSSMRSADDVPAMLFTLLECRRVLRDGAVLRIDTASEPAAALAARVGLAVRTSTSSLCCIKPRRRAEDRPLVSVLIPAYGPRYFAQALASADAQTYEPLEIVVCDDSEGPEIEALVRAHRAVHDVRYLRNATRLRSRANYTRCLEEARGDYVKFLNDDDLLAPTCVERLMGVFRGVPDVTLATSRRRRIDDHGTPLPDQPATRPIVHGDALIAGWTAGNAMLMAGLNFLGEPSTALFRKSDLANGAGDPFRFDGLRGFGIIDMSTWATLSLEGHVAYLGEALSAFRIHAQQRQSAPEVRQRSIDSIRELQAAWLKLGLHLRIPRDAVLHKPIAAGDDVPWTLVQLLTFAPPPPLVEWSASMTILAPQRR